MRAVIFGFVLALAALSTGAQAGLLLAGKPPTIADRSVAQHPLTGFDADASSQAGRLPVHRVTHDMPRLQYRALPQRRTLLQRLFVPRRAVQPQRTQRRAARVAPRAAPHTHRHRASPAALAPRPAPEMRTPQQRTVAPRFLPTIVDYESEHEPGTIIVDTGEKFLYLVQEGGKARRYGVGVGRDGFGWSGTVQVGRKTEWPTWTPPREMIKRQPWLARYSGGMPGGPNNPLGARALYLFDGDRDTLFRIHGSNEPWTIGQAVSSGCFRMRNEDVKELYEQVPLGTKVVVL